jgi:hypothetical protein
MTSGTRDNSPARQPASLEITECARLLKDMPDGFELVLSESAPDEFPESSPTESFARVRVGVPLLERIAEAQADCKRAGYLSVSMAWPDARVFLNGATHVDESDDWQMNISPRGFSFSGAYGGDVIFSSSIVNTEHLRAYLDDDAVDDRVQCGTDRFTWIGGSLLISDSQRDYVDAVTSRCPDLSAELTAAAMRARVASPPASASSDEMAVHATPRRRRMGV